VGAGQDLSRIAPTHTSRRLRCILLAHQRSFVPEGGDTGCRSRPHGMGAIVLVKGHGH
jgi:hypothetical protein